MNPISATLPPERSADDGRRTVACGTALVRREVAGLRVTEAEYEEVTAKVREVADKILDVVKERRSGLGLNLTDAFAMDRHANERAARFINDNNLLNRYISDGEVMNPATEKVNGSVDQLIVHLRQLKGITSLKVKAIAYFSQVPFSHLVLGAEPVSRVVTIKEHIEQIGASINAGIKQMRENNVELVHLHENTRHEIDQLSREVVYVDVLLKELESRLDTDSELAQDDESRTRLQLEVLARLERFAMDQKALHSTLVASTEAINQQLAVNHGVIEGAIRLQRVAQPAIAITAAIRITARDAKRELVKDEMIRHEVVSALNDMGKAIQENHNLLLDLYGRSVIPAEDLARNMKLLKNERARVAGEMRKLYDKNRADNRRFDEILRDGREVLEGQRIGNQMDLILSGEGVEERPARP